MIKRVYPLLILFLASFISSQATPGCHIGAAITPGDQTICSGSSVTFSASPTGSAYTYAWSTGDSTVSITESPTSNITYTVTITDTVIAHCSQTATVNVTVNPVPNAGINYNGVSVCTSQPVALTATGGGTYHWSTGSNSANITVHPSNTTTYTVTVTKNGCSSTATVSVSVNSAGLAALFTNCNAVEVSPYTITITDISTPPTGNTNYTIIWGDTGANYSSGTMTSLTHTYGAGAFNLTYWINHLVRNCADTLRSAEVNLKKKWL